MAMGRALSGLAYPERFDAAASYAGFAADTLKVTSNFKSDVALLLYALYQQATVGPCNVPKPRSWSPVEQSKWKSWNGLGNMANTEAMRLFVKILEEEDPGWYSRADTISDPVVDVQMNYNSKGDAAIENDNSVPETKMVSTENGVTMETQDKDVVSEGNAPTVVYDQWAAPPTMGQQPKPRYEHGAAVVGDKMYVYGGNHNGRYLSDLQVLDLRTWSWSRVEVKAGVQTEESESSVSPIPCAGHTLIPWGNKLLSVAGHTKGPSEGIQVREFDLQTSTWSILKTYGNPPASRGGHSVTIVGSSLLIFGGQGANRKLLNDMHLLDLETLTWDEYDAAGVPPSPRSDHVSVVHEERYLLIFGGGSHATCFSDLHVLDLQAMEWSRPNQQGDIPSARAGHAGVAIGENWFIVGGGDTRSGAAETVALNMSTFVWSVVTSVEGRASLASEGLSLVVGFHNGEDVLVSFGGYNGRYNNEVHFLKPSHKLTSLSKMIETPVPERASAVHNATNGTRDLESEVDAGQDGGIREIPVDNVDAEKLKSEQSGDRLVAALMKEKELLASELNKKKLQNQQLKQELAETETRNTDIYKELQSIHGQLAAEQSRSFKLEVEVAELRLKLQTMKTLEKELELLHKQKSASEQAALNARQKRGSGRVWGWLGGSSSTTKDDA